MKHYWISYQTTGNKYFCDGITWCCRISAESVADAINELIKIEGNCKITKFESITESEG